jgi:hypothetical protein
MRIIAKILQAMGIAEVMIGLVTGLMGDMWKELYFTVAGVVVFAIGWFLQRRVEKKAAVQKQE